MLFSDITSKQKKAILKTTTSRQILCLREIIINILQGNISFTKIIVNLLKPYKAVFRKIATSQKYTREYIVTKTNRFLSILKILNKNKKNILKKLNCPLS